MSSIEIEKFDSALEEAKKQLARECTEALQELFEKKPAISFVICLLHLPEMVPNSLSYPRPHLKIYAFQEQGNITEEEYLGYYWQKPKKERNRLKDPKPPRNIAPDEVPFSKLSIADLRVVAERLQNVTSQINQPISS